MIEPTDASIDAVRRALAAWGRPRNAARATAGWRFTVEDAGHTLERLFRS